MTLLEIIQKLLGTAAGQMGHVKDILAAVVAKYPDTAGSLNPIIAELDAPVSPESLATLVSALPQEVLNIARFKLDPKFHAGDAV
jgi:hypothetical protein